MRDSFIFYSSFLRAIEAIKDERIRGELALAVIRYGIQGTMTECGDIVSMAMELIKPQIDANYQKYLNGCKGGEYGKKGGRPKNETPKKPLKNPNETPNENENENENDLLPPTPQRGAEEDGNFDFNSLAPPDDGVDRNFRALVEHLKKYNFSNDEKKKIIIATNFGEIGHPFWGLISEVRYNSGIKFPARFIVKRLGL